MSDIFALPETTDGYSTVALMWAAIEEARREKAERTPTVSGTALHLTAVASSAGSGIIADAAVYYSDPHAPGAVQRLEAIGHDIARLIAAHSAAVAAHTKAA